MGRAIGHLLRGAAVLAACLPLSVIVTLLAQPLWSWIETTLGVEAVGHSGPAQWCFLATYALCVACGVVGVARWSAAPSRGEA
jgi:type II secretory pathway component PulK